MKYLCFALLGAVYAQTPPTCSTEVSRLFTQCVKSLPISTNGSPYDPAYDTLKAPATKLSICYGDYPLCNDIQKIAQTDAAQCAHYVGWKGMYTIVGTSFSKCEEPLPPRLVEKKFCTYNGLVLSEFYSKLYADVARNNVNEQFTYNQTGRVIIAKSNGQCLEGIPQVDGSKYSGSIVGVKTAPCDLNNANQQWDLIRDEIRNPAQYSLRTDTYAPGSQVAAGYPYTRFRDCSGGPIKVHIVSYQRKRISEYYSGLYFDNSKDNTNEIFYWDANTLMLKSESSQQCLDSYLDSDGKYKVHTYPCDVNNPNQKWDVHTETRKIHHRTHSGQCLDGDPTYPDHHVQMWPCIPDNPNQQWELEFPL